MGRALVPMFTVFSLIIGLGVIALALSFYSRVTDVQDSVFDCMKLDGAAQMKCVESLGRQAESLGKVARSVTAPN